jgi:hypothetical protein
VSLGVILAAAETKWLGVFIYLPSYSRVHISSDEVFSKILKKPSIVHKKMIPHMKAFGLLIKMKQLFSIFFEKKNSKWPPKKRSFSSSANSQYIFVKILWICSWVSRID